MDAEYYKKYEPVFGKWYITKQLGAGSYGKVFEIQRTDALDGTVYRGALKAITIRKNCRACWTRTDWTGREPPPISGRPW